MTTATRTEIEAAAAAARTKIASITIEWSESPVFPTEGVEYSAEVAEAMAVAAMHASNEAHEGSGAYHKTKFVATFANGNTHTGRIDFDGSRQSFAAHIVEFYINTMRADRTVHRYITDEHAAACAEGLAYLIG